jgi:hypothetical protein
MRKIQTIVAIATLLLSSLSITASAENKQANKVEPLPRDLEIQLALSALPPDLRDGATVYVLNPDKGFEVARKGTNEFHALVARTYDDAARGSWEFKAYRDDVLVPVSFDEAASRQQMRVLFDISEMQANGTPPGKLKKIIKARYKGGHYKAPKRTSVMYMLAPILRTYKNADKGEKVSTLNVPHVMYSAPNVTNEDIGAKPDHISMYPMVDYPGPHGRIIQPVGVSEREAINEEYGEMLAKLCQIKESWCLAKVEGQH